MLPFEFRLGFESVPPRPQRGEGGGAGGREGWREGDANSPESTSRVVSKQNFPQTLRTIKKTTPTEKASASAQNRNSIEADG